MPISSLFSFACAENRSTAEWVSNTLEPLALLTVHRCTELYHLHLHYMLPLPVHRGGPECHNRRTPWPPDHHQSLTCSLFFFAFFAFRSPAVAHPLTHLLADSLAARRRAPQHAAAVTSAPLPRSLTHSLTCSFFARSLAHAQRGTDCQNMRLRLRQHMRIVIGRSMVQGG